MFKLGGGLIKSIFGARIGRRSGLQGGMRAKGFYEVTCRDPDGNVKWVEKIENLVVNEGLNHILDVQFHGAAQVDPWYIGLLEGTPSPAAGWTKTDVGAADFVDYDETTLQEFVENAPSGQSIDNVTTEAVFTISQDASTIGGAYLASVNTKAVAGGAAVIYSAGAFTVGDKSADDNDTLTVTAVFTMADDGV